MAKGGALKSIACGGMSLGIGFKVVRIEYMRVVDVRDACVQCGGGVCKGSTGAYLLMPACTHGARAVSPHGMRPVKQMDATHFRSCSCLGGSYAAAQMGLADRIDSNRMPCCRGRQMVKQGTKRSPGL